METWLYGKSCLPNQMNIDSASECREDNSLSAVASRVASHPAWQRSSPWLTAIDHKWQEVALVFLAVELYEVCRIRY